MWFATSWNLSSDDEEAGGTGGSEGSESSLSLSENVTPLLRGFLMAEESLSFGKGSDVSIREDGCITLVTVGKG